MATESRAGRPRASSRETLAEAACELFLEQGYEATSVVDIAQRAGVSRSSFFNYFSSKSDVLWSGLDARIAAASVALAALGRSAD
ncbi:MAG TPA: helix-turn-helix domain-containing protein, partial [Microbacterium sp.]|nr:helix-turn-helix domain-containing protein [Microbacterium sp.]